MFSNFSIMMCVARVYYVGKELFYTVDLDPVVGMVSLASQILMCKAWGWFGLCYFLMVSFRSPKPRSGWIQLGPARIRGSWQLFLLLFVWGLVR